jgi:ribonuclease-3
MTHRSAGSANNERLEFLGDAILGYLVAESLYHRNPRAREGLLTRARANLVRQETLAAVARDLDLGDHLVLGGGERKSGGRSRDSILADAMEALLGAVYLDGGMEEARRIVEGWYGESLEPLGAGDVEKDPKTRLQELLQGRKAPLPIYEVTSTDGTDHRKVFSVRCTVEALSLAATGAGRSRRRAEQQAAQRVIDLIGDDG